MSYYNDRLKSGERLVTVSAATTLSVGEHDSKILMLDNASGFSITLPQATGSGARFGFVVKTALTENDYIIQVANATDVMAGTVALATDIAGVSVPTTATSDTITMNGSTKGGAVGSFVEIVDVDTGVFMVTGTIVSTGSEATPFSAAVS